MSRLRADERLCPFCAEPVKKAAIKCRWCGSELSPESVESPEESPRSIAFVERKVGERPTRAPRAGRSGLLPILFTLALLAVAAVVFAVVRANAQETAPDGTVTSNSQRAVAMQQVADATATALSYKAATFEADVTAAGKLMTPSMRSEYDKALAPVKAEVMKNSISLKATVVASSLVRQTHDTVKALIFVNQSTTATGASNEQLDNNRVVVTMKRSGDTGGARWLISKMDAF